MSIVKSQTRGYARDCKGDPAEKQEGRLLAADCDVIYVEGRNKETLDACLTSLHEGDTLAVGSLSRLHNSRDGIRAAVERVLSRGVLIWEIDTGRRLGQSSLSGIQAVFEALDHLSNRRHTWNSDSAKMAAMKRWNRTPGAQAEPIWRNYHDFPTAESALAHPDMAGWTKAQAYRAFKKRGSAPWSRDVVSPNANVYFIRDGNKRRVKIGMSTNVENRLKGLAHPFLGELTVMGTVPGGYAMEREMHHRFAEHRISGEWFKLEGDLAEFVKTLSPYTPT